MFLFGIFFFLVGASIKAFAPANALLTNGFSCLILTKLHSLLLHVYKKLASSVAMMPRAARAAGSNRASKSVASSLLARLRATASQGP